MVGSPVSSSSEMAKVCFISRQSFDSSKREVVNQARQDDSSGVDGSNEPLLAADQVLVVSTAWFGNSRCVLGSRRRDLAARRACREARSQRQREPGRYSGLHHERLSGVSNSGPLSPAWGLRCSRWPS